MLLVLPLSATNNTTQGIGRNVSSPDVCEKSSCFIISRTYTSASRNKAHREGYFRYVRRCAVVWEIPNVIGAS